MEYNSGRISSQRMYVCFEGVKDPERLLRIILRLTDGEVLCAPGLVGVYVGDIADSEILMGNRDLQDLEDTPEGFWIMEVTDDDGFRDRVETAMRHYPGKGRLKYRK